MRSRTDAPVDLAALDAVILCGGLGTRLRETVPDGPKGLAPIGGRPFMDILVEDLLRQGLRRFVLCVGYLKEQFVERYGERDDAEFVFSEEEAPLGTGGAVQHALPKIGSDPFLVLNGDSFCQVDLADLISCHRRSEADATFVLSPRAERYDGGTVCLDRDDRVRSFLERNESDPAERCYLNGGVYVLDKAIAAAASRRPPFSLERDVFPSVVQRQKCVGFVIEQPVVDIGTPERYRAADRQLR